MSVIDIITEPLKGRWMCVISLYGSADACYMLNQKLGFNILKITFLPWMCCHTTYMVYIHNMVRTQGTTIPAYTLINHQGFQLIMKWYTATYFASANLQGSPIIWAQMHCMAMREEQSTPVRWWAEREESSFDEGAAMFIVIILTRLIYCRLYLMRVYRREGSSDGRQSSEAGRCNEML